MNKHIEKLANIWANRRFEENSKVCYTFTAAALEVFAGKIALQCSEIADTAEPFASSDLIKKHFGINHETGNL